MPKEYHFLEGQVVVTVPEVAAGMLRAVSRPIGRLNMNPTSGNFKPIRVLINVVLEEEGMPGTYLTELKQSVQIRVQYTASDAAEAAKFKKPLALGFWDGKEWVRFEPTKHAFALLPDAGPSHGGYATVTITRWGDPPVAWGV